MRDSGGPLTATDRRFMNALYERFANYIYSATGKYTENQAEREDIAQETVLRLLDNCATLQNLTESALFSYIRFTVKSAALDCLGKNRKSESLDQCPEPPAEGLTLEEAFIYAEDQAQWSACLQKLLPQLKPEEQFLLEGRYIWQLDDKTLAAALHCKASSVRMMLTRARRKALKLIREGGVEHG